MGAITLYYNMVGRAHTDPIRVRIHGLSERASERVDPSQFLSLSAPDYTAAAAAGEKRKLSITQYSDSCNKRGADYCPLALLVAHSAVVGRSVGRSLERRKDR